MFASLSGCFTVLAFADANRARSSHRPIPTRRPHIKKLCRLAAEASVDLWFEDECHFQQHGSRCTMWIPPEDIDPIVLHAPTRKHVAAFGAVCPADGRLSTLIAPTFDASTFRTFLGQLLRRRRSGRKMVVVLDNAGWHRARALAPWLHDHKNALHLDFLPPYSPELNVAERVWKLTRRLCTHNQYFASLELLIDTVAKQLNTWFKPNRQLQRLCAVS